MNVGNKNKEIFSDARAYKKKIKPNMIDFFGLWIASFAWKWGSREFQHTEISSYLVLISNWTNTQAGNSATCITFPLAWASHSTDVCWGNDWAWTTIFAERCLQYSNITNNLNRRLGNQYQPHQEEIGKNKFWMPRQQIMMKSFKITT